MKYTLIDKFNTYTLNDITLRPYQKRLVKYALKFLKKFGATRLYWVVPMGGGKTFMGIAYLLSLEQLTTKQLSKTFSTNRNKHFKKFKNTNTVTIITYVPSAQAKWVTEIQHVFNETHNIIFINKQSLEKRINIWFLEGIDKSKPTIILCRIHTLANDWAILEEVFKKKLWFINTLLVDEAHVLLNRRTKLFGKIKKITNEKYCHNMICMTGTDQSRGLQDIYSVLHLLDRIAFSSYWKFRKTWLYEKHSTFGVVVDGIKRGVKKQLLYELRYIYMFVKEKEARKYIPSKNRHILRYDLDKKTAKIYDGLQKNNHVRLGKNAILKCDGLLVKETRLRQLTSCPQILLPKLSIGNAIKTVLKHCFKKDKKPIIMIGTVFTQILPLYYDYLVKTNKFDKLLMIDNYSKPQDILAEFEACKEQKLSAVLLVSITKSVGWDLYICNTAYAIIPSFSDNNNKQWEDRMARGDASKVSNIYYLCANNTVNERHLSIINTKNERVQELTRKKVYTRIT